MRSVLLVLCGVSLLWAATVAAASPAYDQVRADLDAGRYAEAASGLEAILAEQPEWGSGWRSLGQVQYLLGEPEEAHASLQKAASLDVDPWSGYFMPGAQLFRQRKYAEAVEPLRRALELAPAGRKASTAKTLGYALFKVERYGEAADVLKPVEAGQDPQVLYHLAESLRRRGDYDGALSRVRRLAALPTGVAGFDAARASARWAAYQALLPENAGRRSELLPAAIVDAKAWNARDEGDGESRSTLVKLLAAAERWDEVAGIALSRPECPAPLWLARARMAQGRPVEAEAAATTALDCEGEASAASFELARALAVQLAGDYETAEAVHVDRERVARALEVLGDGESAGARENSAPRADAVRDLVADLRAADRNLRERLDRFDRDRAERLREIRERCLALRWKARNSPLTEDEELFVEDNRCRRFDP
ncbi:hypothetical protein ABI59_13935 [Acidobacteria bacterium Mor1]|nr:hypothetical protein ABI59_13935 [Acidobacteria bacterium Mor1]